jgi:hypothetical protein
MAHLVDQINDHLMRLGLSPHLDAQTAQDAYGRGYILLVDGNHVDIYQDPPAVARILQRQTPGTTPADHRAALWEQARPDLAVRELARGQWHRDITYGRERDIGLGF